MPDVNKASSTTSTAATAPRAASKPQTEPLPQFNVILLNDDHHTYEYVILMLRRLFGHPETRGYQLAQAVDKHGRAILLTTHMELAELKRDQIHAFGSDPRLATSAGSMMATIEPVQ